MDLLTGRISAPLLLYRKFFLLRIMTWVIMYHVTIIFLFDELKIEIETHWIVDKGKELQNSHFA